MADTKEDVWTTEELHREEVRGVFVLGVIAILFGFYQTDAVKAIFSSGSTYGGILLNSVTVYLVAFWGLYVVCTAMSFASWKAGSVGLQILTGLKSLASFFFYLGATLTLALVALLGPFVIIDSLGRNPFYSNLIFLAGFVVLIGVFVWRWWGAHGRSGAKNLVDANRVVTACCCGS